MTTTSCMECDVPSLVRITPMRVVVLVSGGGTTMEQVLFATLPMHNGPVPYGMLNCLVEVVGVISSKKEAGALVRVEQFNEMHRRAVAYTTMNLKKCGGDERRLGRAMAKFCKDLRADAVIGCGYLKKVPREVLDAFPGMVFNQHCAPLDPGFPDFGGPGMYGEAAHKAVRIFAKSIDRRFSTRAVVHKMTPDYDKGAIVAQSAELKVDRRWGAKRIQAELLPLEHLMVINALAIIACHYPMRDVPAIALTERVVRRGEKRRHRWAVRKARDWTTAKS